MGSRYQLLTIILSTGIAMIIVFFSTPVQSNFAQLLTSESDQNVTAVSNLTTSSGNNWTTYTNDALGISFDYPSNWQVKEKQGRFELTSDVTASDGIRSFTFSKFDETLNGMLNRLGLAKSVNQFERIYGQQEESRIIEKTDMKKYEIDGERTGTFLYTIENVDGSTTAQQKFIVQHGDSGYSLNFQDSTLTFDDPETQNIMNKIIKSFKFLE